jgi:hypothetical protein
VDLTEMIPRRPQEQLAYVLRFLRENVDGMDARAQVVWSSRLKSLALPPLTSGRLKVQFQAIVSYQAFPAKDLKTLQSEISDGLREVLTPVKSKAMAHVWQLPDLRGGGMFRDFDGAGYIWQWTFEGELWPIILGAARLVADHAERIRLCKRCGVPFLAVKRQEYCTKAHGQAARDERKAEQRKGGSR